MNEEQIAKNLIELAETKARGIIEEAENKAKEIVSLAVETDKEHYEGLLVKAVQSGKKETSDLIYSLKESNKQIRETHITILDKLESIDGRFKTLNGSVSKQADKLAQHDIINAQTTITQQQTAELLKGITTTMKDYEVNKGRIWLAVGLLTIFGGALITLSIMAIDSKIEKGIQQALINNVKEINYEK